MKTVFRYKDINMEWCDFKIGKMVELPKGEYDYFTKNLLKNHEFIKDYAKEMYPDPNDKYVKNCLLVLCEGEDDGILVCSEGAPNARYSAPMVNARQVYAMQKFPSLKKVVDVMQDAVEHCVAQAVEFQLDGECRIEYKQIEEYAGIELATGELLEEMLSECSEVGCIEADTEGIDISIAEPFIQEDEQLKELTQEEIEVIAAKHILWNHGQGGQQAKFSNCLLKNVSLANKQLNGALFDNAKFVNVDMHDGGFCFSTFNGARLYDCNCKGMVAEEAALINARFARCHLETAVFTHSNLKDTEFFNCTADRTSLQNCCLEGTDLEGLAGEELDRRGTINDEEEWKTYWDGLNMGGQQ